MQALAMPASRYIFGTLPWYSVTMVCAILSALLLAQAQKKFAAPRLFFLHFRES